MAFRHDVFGFAEGGLRQQAGDIARGDVDQTVGLRVHCYTFADQVVFAQEKTGLSHLAQQSCKFPPNYAVAFTAHFF